MRITHHLRAALLALLPVLAACGNDKVEAKYPTSGGPGNSPTYEEPRGIFGRGGLFGSDDEEDAAATVGIGVNAYLWRASLDTVAFLPLVSADPFGGTILTDWHSPAETPDERFKVNVYILDRALRADGVRVAVFRQRKDHAGAWRDAEINPRTATQLEDAILTRARELRVAERG